MTFSGLQGCRAQGCSKAVGRPDARPGLDKDTKYLKCISSILISLSEGALGDGADDIAACCGN